MDRGPPQEIRCNDLAVTAIMMLRCCNYAVLRRARRLAVLAGLPADVGRSRLSRVSRATWYHYPGMSAVANVAAV